MRVRTCRLGPLRLDGAPPVIGACTLGAYTEGDCGYYGGKCSEADGAHCVHYMCWTNLDGAEDGAFCKDDDVRGTCAAGVFAERSCAAEGLTCRDGACIDAAGGVVPGPGEERPPPPLPTTVPAQIAVGDGDDDDDDGHVAPAAKGGSNAPPRLPPSVEEGGCAQTRGATAGALAVLLGLVASRRRRATR